MNVTHSANEINSTPSNPTLSHSDTQSTKRERSESSGIDESKLKRARTGCNATDSKCSSLGDLEPLRPLLPKVAQFLGLKMVSRFRNTCRELRSLDPVTQKFGHILQQLNENLGDRSVGIDLCKELRGSILNSDKPLILSQPAQENHPLPFSLFTQILPNYARTKLEQVDSIQFNGFYLSSNDVDTLKSFDHLTSIIINQTGIQESNLLKLLSQHQLQRLELDFPNEEGGFFSEAVCNALLQQKKLVSLSLLSACLPETSLCKVLKMTSLNSVQLDEYCTAESDLNPILDTILENFSIKELVLFIDERLKEQITEEVTAKRSDIKLTIMC